MHLYFSGIGGAGISALAHLALDCGFEVSGSDKHFSAHIEKLTARGVTISLNQTGKEIEIIHKNHPIDWLIHTSGMQLDNPELVSAINLGIKLSKRESLIKRILDEKKLKLLAICGTHGKTTTTAMFSWLMTNLKLPVAHIIGSEISWGQSGQYQEGAEYLILEADEFDRHFLAYKPQATVLTSLDYDHPDTYPTVEEYHLAFKEFISASGIVSAFIEDLNLLKVPIWQDPDQALKPLILPRIFAGHIVDYDVFELAGLHNRQNAALVQAMASKLTGKPTSVIESILSTFPGTRRRMEKIQAGLYSDYAHSPAEVKATLELGNELNPEVVVVFQPHQNLRQHALCEGYKDAFLQASKVYWLPTYLSREPAGVEILSPEFLSSHLANQEIVEISQLNEDLKLKILEHLTAGKLVICMGAGDIDDWLRKEFSLPG